MILKRFIGLSTSNQLLIRSEETRPTPFPFPQLGVSQNATNTQYLSDDLSRMLPLPGKSHRLP